MFLERLVAGALLYFKREIDQNDLNILEDLANSEIVEHRFMFINDIIIESDNKYKLAYDLDTVLGNNLTIREYLEQIEGDYLKGFFNNLDLKEFLIRKADIGEIKTLNLQNSLSEKEIDALIELQASGFVGKSWSDDGTIYNDYEKYYVTKKGQVYLFMKKYNYQVQAFRKELEEKGYNPDLIMLYLETRNLERPFLETFDIEAFKLFGSIYDLDITLPKKMVL